MSFRNWIDEKVILPSSDMVFSQSISKSLKFLQESQWWKPGEIENFQNEKLKELVRHAYGNVPYYKELFNANKLSPNDIKTKDDLPKIPILTKEIIKRNFPDKIVASNIPDNQKVYLSSSGSTGEPLQYYSFKKAASFKTACNLRGLYWHGFRLGDKHCKLSIFPRTGLKKKLQDIFTNCHYIFSESISQTDIVSIVGQILKFKPKMIYGYPSTLFVLADYIERNNITISGLSFINTHGEILIPNHKEIMEKAFNCSVIDAYSGEGGAIIFECIKNKLYHIADEYAITEIIRDGETINEEGEGDIVSTDLWNYALPMLRYNIKDVGVLKKDKCDCGRGLSLLHQIKGRDSDILVTPSGKNLIVHFFTGFFEWLSTVEQFQVRQHAKDKIEVLLVRNDQYTDAEEKKIYTEVKNYIGSDVDLELTYVNDIPLTRSGKRRFIIREF